MKIVKEFKSSSDLLLAKRYGIHNANWLWGLGDDGRLYGMCTNIGHEYSFSMTWVLSSNLGFGIPLDEMKKIVKEFGNLVVFT